MPPKRDLGLDSLIQEVRGQKVMLDADLAKVYGVDTRSHLTNAFLL